LDNEFENGQHFVLPMDFVEMLLTVVMAINQMATPALKESSRLVYAAASSKIASSKKLQHFCLQQLRFK